MSKGNFRPIHTRPPSNEYRKGHDATFGEKCPECGGKGYTVGVDPYTDALTRIRCYKCNPPK